MADPFEGWTVETPQQAEPQPLPTTPSMPMLQADPFAAWTPTKPEEWTTIEDPDAKWRKDQLEKAAADERWDRENEVLRKGWAKAAQAPSDEAGIQAMAQFFRIPTKTAEIYKSDFAALKAGQEFDPDVFRRENPELARLLLEHPELGTTVQKEVKLGKLAKALRVVQDKLTDYKALIASKGLGTGGGALAIGLGALATGQDPSAAVKGELDQRLAVAATPPEERAAAREKRDAPTLQTFVDNPGAKYIREEAPHLAPFGELSQNWEDLAIAELESNLANRYLLGIEGQGTADIEREVLDRRLRNPRYDLGETGIFTEALVGSASTSYVMAPVKTGRGSIDYSLGLLSAPAAGMVARTPGGKLLVGAILAKGTFQLEQGGALSEFKTMKTDDGQALTKREAAAAATVYAVASTAIELGEFGILAGLGKSAGAVSFGGKTGLKAAWKALVGKDPAFRAMLTQAGAALAGEPLEEGTQSLTQSAVRYFAKSLKQGEFQAKGIGQADVEDALEQAGAVIPFSVVQTAGAAAVGKIAAAIDRDNNLIGNSQVEELAKHDSEATKSFPAAVASLIADSTAKTGQPVTHLYIDAEALAASKLFQGSLTDEKGNAVKPDDILGPDAERRVREGIETGQKVEIEGARYAEKLAGTPLAEELAPDTTVRPLHHTTRELQENPDIIEEQAKALVAAEDAAKVEAKKTEKKFLELEAAVGQVRGKGEAAVALKLIRALDRTTRAVAGDALMDKILDEDRVRLASQGKLDDSLLQKGAAVTDALEERALSEDPAQHARDVHIDPVTELRNFDTWNAEEQDPRGVIAVTIADIKPINDSPQGGHTTADLLLRTLAPIARAADPKAARKGTTFLVRGDAATAAAIGQAMQRAVPQGLRVEAAHGADTQKSLDALDAQVDAKRLTGELPKDRGATAFDLKTLPQVEQQLQNTQVEPAELTPEMLDRAAKATPKEKFKSYSSKRFPGVLSAVGFQHAGERAHVAALDVKGLKAKFNKRFGKWAGDLAIAKIAEIAEDIGGHAVAFAHLSGDEFAMKADDLAELKQFAEDLEAELTRNTVRLYVRTLKDGTPLYHDVAVEVRIGIGEKTYGAADRALNASKAAEGDQPGGTGAAGGRRADAEGRGAPLQGRDAVDARRARAQQRGTPRAPRLDRREAGRGDERGGSAEAADAGAVEGARATIAAFEAGKNLKKTPGQREADREAVRDGLAAAKAWVEYCADPSKPRPEVDLKIKSFFLSRHGLADPLGVDFDPGGMDLVEEGHDVAEAQGSGNGGALWKAQHPDDYDRLTYAEQARVDANLDPARGGKKGGSGRMFQSKRDGLAPIIQKAEKAGLKLDVVEGDDFITLSRIVVPEAARGAGVGTATMQEISDYADSVGKPIALTPSTAFGGSKARLTRFYKGLGFVENKGRKKDFRTRETMIRLPTPGKLFQLPTPAQSLKAMKDLQIFLDAVREKGARAIEPEEVADALENKHDNITRQKEPKGRRGVIPSVELQIAERRARLADAHAANAAAGADQRVGADVETDMNWVRVDSAREASAATPPTEADYPFRTGKIDQIPKSQSLPGQKELEAYLDAVNADPARLFQDADLVEAIKAALSGNTAKAEEYLLNAGDPKNPRGSIAHIRDGVRSVFQIALNPNADASTFLHESAHVFLELFAELAQHPEAPARVKADFAEALKWLGADPTKLARNEHGWSFSRDMHEKWADGFLVYLREGKAPSSALQSAFRRFEAWLKKIYQTVGELGVELNPEIRGIFDRLLATDEEIADTKRAMGAPLFGNLADALAAGLSPERFAEYLDDQEKAASHAEKLAKLKFLKEELRTKDKAWKEELATLVETARGEYEELPARKAQLVIAGMTGEETGEFLPLKVALDRAAVEAAVGVAAARKFKLAKDGVQPDEIAGQLGFDTGAEMLKAVEVLPVKELWAKKRAEWLMTERHPGMLEDREQLREEVGKGLHGDWTLRALEKEIAAISSKAPNGFTGQTPAEAIQEAARIMANRTPVGKLNPRTAQAAERKAANAALRAMAKGDFEMVLVQKQKQLLNLHLYRELAKAKAERQSFEKFVKRVGTKKNAARLGKALPLYRDAMTSLLERFGLVEPAATGAIQVDLTAVENQLASEAAIGAFDRPALEALIQKLGMKTWEDLKLPELRVVRGALENIQGAATDRNAVILGEAKADVEDVVKRLKAEWTSEKIRHRGGYKTIAPANTLIENVGGLFNAWDGALLRPANMLAELSGGDTESVTCQALIEPLRKSKHMEADLLAGAAEPIIEAYEAMPDEVRKTFMDDFDGAKAFPGHTDRTRAPRRRFELLMMLANSGNEGNLDRLLRGRNIQYEELIAAFAQLSKAEIDWVQSIFDAHENPVLLPGETTPKSLKERAFELEERDNGTRPQAVLPRQLVLPNGTLRGGYFPAVYDRNAEQAGERQVARDLAGLFDPNYTAPGTAQGHLQKRVEGFTGILSLDPKIIYSHLGQMIHDIAFRENLKSVGKLVLHPEIDSALKGFLGDGKATQFLAWLKDIGSSRGTLDAALKGWDMIAGFVRGNMAPAILGWKAGNAIGDLANLPTAVAATPLKMRYLGAGLSEYLKDGLLGGGSRAFALQKSGELRFQQDTLQRDFVRNVKELTSRWRHLPGAGAFGWWKDNAFAFMEASLVATSTPIWLGAYRQALREGREDAAAVKWADDIVVQCFPSHSAVEQPAILRNKGFWGVSTVFYGYLSTAYNLQRGIMRPLFGREFAEASKGQKALTLGKVSGSMLAFYVAFAAFGELLMGRGPEDGDRDEDEPNNRALQKANWLKRKLIAAPLSTLPVPVAGRVEAMMLKKRFTPKGQLVDAMVGEFGGAVVGLFNGKLDNEKKIINSARALGLTLGIPTAPLTLGGKYVYDAITTGDTGSPAEVAEGLVYGRRPKQPEGPLTFFTGRR